MPSCDWRGGGVGEGGSASESLGICTGTVSELGGYVDTVDTGLEVATVDVGREGEVNTDETGLDPVGLDALVSVPEFLSGGVPRPTFDEPLLATALPAEMDRVMAGEDRAPLPDVERTTAGEEFTVAGVGSTGGRV